MSTGEQASVERTRDDGSTVAGRQTGAQPPDEPAPADSAADDGDLAETDGSDEPSARWTRWRRLARRSIREAASTWHPGLWVLLVAVVLLPLTVLPWTWRSFELGKFLGMTVVAVALLVLAVPELMARWSRTPPEARLLLAAVGAFAAWTVVRSVTSGVPVVSFLGLQVRLTGSITVVVSAVLVLVLPVLIRRREEVTAVAVALALMLAVLGVHAVEQRTGTSIAPWGPQLGGRPIGTMGNPNMLGAVIALGIPTALYLWRAVPRLRPAVPTFLVFMVGVLYLADSALGALATMTGTAVLVALRWLHTRGRHRESWLLLAVAPVLGHLTAFVVVHVGGVVGVGSSVARVYLHSMAWPMVAAHPLGGVGWGRFEAHHTEFRPPDALTLGSNREVFADSSHDWIVDIAATSGLIGVALALLVLVAAGVSLARAGARLAPAEQAGRRDVHAAPVGAGVVGVVGAGDGAGGDGAARPDRGAGEVDAVRDALHWVAAAVVASGVGLSLTVPVVMMVWLWFLLLGLVPVIALLSLRTGGELGVASGGEPAGPASPAVGPGRWVLTAIAVVLTATILAPFYRSAVLLVASDEVPEADSIVADDRAGQDGVADEVASLQRAADLTPWWPRTWLRLAAAHHSAGDLDAASIALDRALAIDPRHREAVRRAGPFAGERGDHELARAAFDRAVTLDPHGYLIRLDRAAWAIDAGRLQEARADLRLAHERIDPLDRRAWSRWWRLEEALLDAAFPGDPARRPR